MATKADIMVGIIIIGMVIFGTIVIGNLVPLLYSEINTYKILTEQCNNNPDVCYCDSGSCSFKSTCTGTGTCDNAKICDILIKANYKMGLWEYNCTR